tara:strand:+ start:15725 stop:16486 length:762 start_codon:yes stop_codon:yes gene_type:complete
MCFNVNNKNDFRNYFKIPFSEHSFVGVKLSKFYIPLVKNNKSNIITKPKVILEAFKGKIQLEDNLYHIESSSYFLSESKKGYSLLAVIFLQDSVGLRNKSESDIENLKTLITPQLSESLIKGFDLNEKPELENSEYNKNTYSVNSIVKKYETTHAFRFQFYFKDFNSIFIDWDSLAFQSVFFQDNKHLDLNKELNSEELSYIQSLINNIKKIDPLSLSKKEIKYFSQIIEKWIEKDFTLSVEFKEEIELLYKN